MFFSDSIPIDLVIEIFLRLPVKSIGRCRCVSKQWESMLSSQCFTELFLTRSSAQPQRLLFAVQQDNSREWSFFSSPQPLNLYEEKSLSLAVDADFHSKFLRDSWESLKFCGPTSGLICYRQNYRIVICNPSTGQCTSLPTPKEREDHSSFLGFDPIDNTFKVLSISYHGYDKNIERFQILTLEEKGNLWWRKIFCPLDHSPMEGICINGVLYYLATQTDNVSSLIVCFDVRSEKFKFIHIDFIGDCIIELINYKGKLGVITQKYDAYYNDDDDDDDDDYNYPRRFSLKLCMWVVNKKPESSEWSEYFTTNWDVDDRTTTSVLGVTATGEIVLSMNKVSNPFYLTYLNPERNTWQNVEIRGFGAYYKDIRRVKVFVDYVEDIKFIKLKKRLLSPPEDKPSDEASRFGSINKFDSLHILDEDDDDEFT